MYERITAEVKAHLKAKSKSTEGVETFEEFYSLLQSEAVMLQKKYQPQVESYWQSDRYQAILKKKSKNEDITELQDSALIDLYQKIETDFKQGSCLKMFSNKDNTER